MPDFGEVSALTDGGTESRPGLGATTTINGDLAELRSKLGITLRNTLSSTMRGAAKLATQLGEVTIEV